LSERIAAIVEGSIDLRSGQDLLDGLRRKEIHVVEILDEISRAHEYFTRLKSQAIVNGNIVDGKSIDQLMKHPDHELF